MTRLKRPEHAVEVVAKVAFHQCDPLGVAWHGRYFEWLELARTELFASVGLEVDQIRSTGHRMFIAEAKCRYMAPLAYGDVIRVSAWFGAVLPLIRVGYDIYNDTNGRWSARAHTILAVTDSEDRLLPATPESLVAKLPLR